MAAPPGTGGGGKTLGLGRGMVIFASARFSLVQKKVFLYNGILMKRVSLLWLLLGFVLTSCVTVVSNPPGGPNPSPSSPPTVRQHFLFEKSYTNFAWGYQHRGIYVDGRGDIYSYQYGPQNTQPTPPNGEIITDQSLETKYNANRKLIGKVEPRLLQEMTARIRPASLGKQSERVSQGADMGSTQRLAYLWIPQTGTYRKVELRVTGDWAYHNLSPAARELADWLDSLQFGS